jgi:signal transduction histidine kinase
VALQAELAAAEADCMLDETELEVALVNLLVNARDAGARRVVLRTFNRDGAVCLAVSDDGQGMAPEIRRRVFEPYFSTKGEQGTGLGLPQVYGFMHAVGGDVAIESRPGKGTAVILSFPKAPAGTRPGAVRASG